MPMARARTETGPLTSPPSELDVVELSATAARDRMAAGALTSQALTRAYLERIARLDQAGPRLNAIIELNASAVADAIALDAARRSGHLRGPLHGIPILIKDNVDVAGLVNSAGSLALERHRPRQDAFIAARLRAAGAVILGKTNLSEWANFRSTRTTSGWSSRGGQTKNAYALDRNPCGSSSGSGTAIAASLAAMSIGTETDGSIICPAAVSGLVGLKPTVGAVSRTGIIPLAASQDTAGPIARSVADAALLFSVLAGRDAADAATAVAEGKIARDYTSFLCVDALKGTKIGVVRQAMGFHPGVDSVITAAIERMKAQGATVVEVSIPNYNGWKEAELEALLYEFKDGLNRYLEQSGAPHSSLEALIAYNREHAAQVMPYFGQELFEQAQARGPLTDSAYRAARESATRLAGTDGLVAALDGHRLDALLAPSTSPPWVIDYLLGDHSLGGGYSMPAVAGTPSITVPVGELNGLPIGATLMGRAFDEGKLLALAYGLEQAMQARRPPHYAPTWTP